MKNRGQMDILSNYITGFGEETNFPTASNTNKTSLYSVRAPNHYEAVRYPFFADPTKAPMPGDLAEIARAHYPDGLEFLAGQPIFPPDS